MGHFVLCDTTNRSSYQDKASKIGGRLNQKPNVYSLLMLKVRFGGNLLQRTSQILTYRHVDRIFTFSTDPFKRNDKQIEEYRGANLLDRIRTSEVNIKPQH